MFRVGFTLIRRLIFAICLLILLICGAEVGVRVYEGIGKAYQPRLCGGVRERRIATGDIDERGSDLLADRFRNAGERAKCEAAGVRGESREGNGEIV